MRGATKAEREHTVAAYWRESGGWRWELFGDMLPLSILLKLLGTVINISVEEKDNVGWLDTGKQALHGQVCLC